VPHVAWNEFDGTNFEVRVARLTSTIFGPRWLQPWTGASDSSGGINASTTRDSSDASITSVDGVPWVAWSEFDGTNNELRVSRLVAGQLWQEVVGGASPINDDSSRDAFDPDLVTIGGVPNVAWQEDDGTNDEVHVSRLGNGPDWEQRAGGAQINHDGDRDANEPTLADIGGVPYVAWTEDDGGDDQVRVSRLNAALTAWEQPVGGLSPINHDGDGNAQRANLAAIGGVPYVAWQEAVTGNTEIRVARLNTAGTDDWEELVGGESPINQSNTESGSGPRIADIGGVPWVAWRESDGTNTEARVARLEPEFGAATAEATATGATLSVPARTFGLPFAIGFQFGPAPEDDTTFGSAFENETTAEPAPTGADDVTITRLIGGLEPSTGYQFRPFAIASTPAPRVLGGTGAFTTPAGPGAPPGATDVLAAVLSGYRVSPSAFLAAANGGSVAQRRRVGTRVRYTLSERATVSFTVERAAKGRRVRGRCRPATPRNRRARPCRRFARVRGSFSHAGATGANSFRFTGRLRGRKLRAGRHRLVARAVDAAGNASPVARTGFRIVRGRAGR
jgi:hypothetical protein